MRATVVCTRGAHHAQDGCALELTPLQPNAWCCWLTEHVSAACSAQPPAGMYATASAPAATAAGLQAGRLWLLHKACCGASRHRAHTCYLHTLPSGSQAPAPACLFGNSRRWRLPACSATPNCRHSVRPNRRGTSPRIGRMHGDVCTACASHAAAGGAVTRPRRRGRGQHRTQCLPLTQAPSVRVHASREHPRALQPH
jgi:hypothetical protein